MSYGNLIDCFLIDIYSHSGIYDVPKKTYTLNSKKEIIINNSKNKKCCLIPFESNLDELNKIIIKMCFKHAKDNKKIKKLKGRDNPFEKKRKNKKYSNSSIS